MNQQITGNLSLGRDLTLRVYPTGGRALVTVDKPHLILGYILTSAPYIKWINDPAMSGSIAANDYERIMGGLGADGLLSNLAEYLAVEAFRAPTQHQVYGPLNLGPSNRQLTYPFNASGVTQTLPKITLQDRNLKVYEFTNCYGWEVGANVTHTDDGTTPAQLQGITNFVSTWDVRRADGTLHPDFLPLDVRYAVNYINGNWQPPIPQPHLTGYNYGGFFLPRYGTINGETVYFTTGVNWPNITEYNFSWDRTEYLYDPGNPVVTTQIKALVCLVQE